MNKQEQGMREIDIAAYLDGRLTGAEREALERGLEDDRAERDALAMARDVLGAADDAGDVPMRLVNEAMARYPRSPQLLDLVVSFAGRAIEVLSASPGTNIMTPAQAGMVRGCDAVKEPHLIAFKSFNRARVSVHVENMGGNLCQFTVQARDPVRDVPLENARADLVSGRRELASNPLESGTTHFEDVAPGHYDLIVRKNDAVIGRLSVKIIGR